MPKLRSTNVASRSRTPKRGQSAAIRSTTAGLLFVAAWVLWSGHYTALLLFFGALSCALVLVIARRTGFFDSDVYSLHLGPRLPAFWLWLLKEIVASNLSVARIVLRPKLEIEPTWVTIDASHLPPAVQATLANAITLTPGTVSVDIDRGIIEVHCLTREIADDLRGGEMLRRAAALAGD
jgi:multicomponent Na+:H+ antiporter subunit E